MAEVLKFEPTTEASGTSALRPHIGGGQKSGLEAAAGNHRGERVQNMVLGFEGHFRRKSLLSRLDHVASQLAGKIGCGRADACGDSWRRENARFASLSGGSVAAASRPPALCSMRRRVKPARDAPSFLADLPSRLFSSPHLPWNSNVANWVTPHMQVRAFVGRHNVCRFSSK